MLLTRAGVPPAELGVVMLSSLPIGGVSNEPSTHWRRGGYLADR